MKHNVLGFARAGTVLSLAVLASSCRPREYNAGQESAFWNQAAQPSLSEENSTLVFRNLFYSYLKQANYPDERISQLAYLPPNELLREPSYNDTAEKGLSDLRNTFAKYRSSDLFNAGKAVPFQRIAQPEKAFAQTGAITILLVPGIFGEFIDNRPFEEVLDGGSFFNNYRQALASKTDPIFSLQNYKSIAQPLSQSISMGSIDDGSGKQLINLIMLKPNLASLETLGTLESNNINYLRRLDTLFSLLKPEDTKNLYVMGYSRGLVVSLDLITRAWKDRAKHPWIDSVKGVVGLGGVYYGTELADDALNPSEKTITSKAIGTLTWLANELKPVESGSLEGSKKTWNDAAITASNLQKWAQAAYEFNALQGRMTAEQPEGARTDAAALKVEQLNMMATASLLWKVAFEQLNLKDPVGDYNTNIARFKLFVADARKGLETLSTKERFNWWRNNVIPSHIKMFSLTGSMPDAARNGQSSPMLAFDGYAKDSADFASSLRGSFYSLQAFSGNEINDSQVTMYGSRYWPSLSRLINPNQAPLKTYYMGALGTHHWGMAFPIALKTTSGAVNPFPRAALLKTIGTFLSMAEQQ
jgi:hypothetical protein